MTVEFRKCPRCEISKSVSEFQKDNRPGKSWRVWCRPCRKIREREYREEWALERSEKPEPVQKRCSKCKLTKSIEKFVRDRCRPDGFHVWCKDCLHPISRERVANLKTRLTPEEKAARKQIQREKTLLIKQIEFDAMLVAQKGVCRICLLPPKEGKSLNIDHCHKTGRVRGLLCHNCNLGLGLFRDNPTILATAIEYLGVV